MQRIKLIYIGLAVLLFLSFMPAPKKITIWMIGDSTMSVKDTKAYPETGWGMPFVYFFDSTVRIENRAKNGRSSKSFLYENLWQPVIDNMKEGDIVLIQFGHNDESKEKGERYSPPELFKENLLKYVNETKAKKAIPVPITPVSRRKFDETGHNALTHAAYSPLVQEVAVANKVYFIDLDTKSRELYDKLGAETSKLLFLHLKPGEHPNYPDGKEDNTHFSELGARLIAQLVLAELKNLVPDLAQHVVQPVKK
jgi:lysophospholipase L1-like esterase